MSLPKYRLELTDAARLDFDDILLYTLLRWGEQQMNDYSDLIDRAFASIEANPNVAATHAVVDYKCFRAGEHLIFYRVHQMTVFVVRILHSRMDIGRHLR